MRSICAVVGTLALLSSTRAEADASKAWQAAKDHLPATIPAIAGFDVAAIAKLPAATKLLDLLKKEERDVREGFDLLQKACNLDPVKAVDGFVIAGDPDGRDDDIMIFIQLTIDRTKASACLQSMLKMAEPRKPINIKQSGIYTEATVDGETAYFAWVAPNVVAFNADPDNKARLEGFINKKGLAKSPVGALLGKLDPKAAAAGAIKMSKPIDSDIPFTAAYGSAVVSGQNVAATIVATASNANAATGFVNEAKKEIASTARRDRTPAVAKKILNGIAISAAGAEVTVKGSANTSDLLDAFFAMMVKKAPLPPPP